MDTNSQKFKIRLGMFVTGGFLLFFMAIFIIGKQQNLFNPVFKLTTTFHSVSGLQVGNNIRFAGINVGTVDNITIINDTTVGVDMLIRKEIHKFIKADCVVKIGSEGIIGDRLLIITQGGIYTNIAKDGQRIMSNEPVEMDGIMSSLQTTAENAAVISDQLAQIMIKLNSGNGTLGRLIRDSTIAANISETIVNLKKSSKGLDENMNAAKDNFLLKGYFNKKEKAAEKAKKEVEKAKKEAEKAKENRKE